MYAFTCPTDDLPGRIAALEEALRDAEDAGQDARAEMLRDDLRDYEQELKKRQGDHAETEHRG